MPFIQGIVDSVMKELVFEKQQHETQQRGPINSMAPKKIPKLVDKSQEFAMAPEKVNVDPTKRHLYFHISHGKAFLEYLLSNDPDSAVRSTSHFTIHVQFRDQRFRTRAFPCSCEPNINEGFLIEMDKRSTHEASPAAAPSATSLMLDKDGLLAITDKIHLVMVRTDRDASENHLVSSSFVEWRVVLSADGKKQIGVEMMGVGDESKVPAGILYVTLQVVPSLSEPLREDILETQLAIEHSKNTERERLFLVYSKQWWREYLEIREDHKNRYVKIFAQVDERPYSRISAAVE